VRSGTLAGALHYNQLVQKTFFGPQIINPRLQRTPTTGNYVIAAYVHGGAAGGGGAGGAAKDEKVIMIADLDFISNQFFEIRKRGIQGLDFDNVTFFMNCIDMLVGDDSFIALRNRRVKHRTLQTVEARTREYVERRTEEETQAGFEAQRALMAAQESLDEKVRQVKQRTDLDEQTKEIMARNLQEVETRRLEALKATIDGEKDAKIQRSKETVETQIRSIQGGIKLLAGLLPPIPILIVGVIIFVRRRKREKEGAAAARRLRG